MSPAAARATVLAMAGTGTLVTEYKRRVSGYSWWKQVIFDLTRWWLRFCDTKLHLPTIVHHDRTGDFTIDYCGWYDDRELALRAIARMNAERDAATSQLGWVDLPRNGVAPEHSGRHYDADFPTTPTAVFSRANRLDICPFDHSCAPISDEQMRALIAAGNNLYATATSRSI